LSCCFRKTSLAWAKGAKNCKFSAGFRYGQHALKVLNGGFESHCEESGYELKHNNLDGSNGHSRNVNELNKTDRHYCFHAAFGVSLQS
jgi:hypothetical protein